MAFYSVFAGSVSGLLDVASSCSLEEIKNGSAQVEWLSIYRIFAGSVGGPFDVAYSCSFDEIKNGLAQIDEWLPAPATSRIEV